MRIGLIDVDAVSRGKVTYPNLALMKISAWHKEQGDTVEWYPTEGDSIDFPYVDKCYVSRVFSEPYTHDYTGDIWAGEIIRGGADMQSKSRTSGNAIIRNWTRLSRMKRNTSTLTIACTPSPLRTAGMPTAL